MSNPIGKQTLLNSCFIDIGNTTRTALCMTNNEPKNYLKVFKTVKKHNNGSESNGGLMRITPLAVWCRHLSLEGMYSVVEFQTNLTHCHEHVIEACYVYCVAIQHLLNNPNDTNKFENAY